MAGVFGDVGGPWPIYPPSFSPVALGAGVPRCHAHVFGGFQYCHWPLLLGIHYIYMYVCMCMHIYIYIYIYTCICTHVYTPICF